MGEYPACLPPLLHCRHAWLLHLVDHSHGRGGKRITPCGGVRRRRSFCFWGGRGWRLYTCCQPPAFGKPSTQAPYASSLSFHARPDLYFGGVFITNRHVTCCHAISVASMCSFCMHTSATKKKTLDILHLGPIPHSCLLFFLYALYSTSKVNGASLTPVSASYKQSSYILLPKSSFRMSIPSIQLVPVDSSPFTFSHFSHITASAHSSLLSKSLEYIFPCCREHSLTLS